MENQTKLNQIANSGNNMQNANNHPTTLELLQNYAGLGPQIKTILEYHYDQIYREIKTELSEYTKEEQTQILCSIIEYMEDNIYIPQTLDELIQYIGKY